MKNSIKFALSALMLVALASCKEPQRSSASYNQSVSFEMAEYYMDEYFVDGLMYTPFLSWDDVAYFCSSSEETNKGYLGGFKLSNRTGGEEDSDELATFTSAGESAGVGGSSCYLAYCKTTSMPEYDIQYSFGSFYSASTGIIGCYIDNSLYNTRLKDEGKLSQGDWLKVTIEFYNNGTPAGSLSKYLIDYTGPELKMTEDWVEWNMSDQAKNEGVTTGTFDAIKFKVEVSGGYLKPCFCMDNFTFRIDVVY